MSMMPTHRDGLLVSPRPGVGRDLGSWWLSPRLGFFGLVRAGLRHPIRYTPAPATSRPSKEDVNPLRTPKTSAAVLCCLGMDYPISGLTVQRPSSVWRNSPPSRFFATGWMFACADSKWMGTESSRGSTCGTWVFFDKLLVSYPDARHVGR